MHVVVVELFLEVLAWLIRTVLAISLESLFPIQGSRLSTLPVRKLRRYCRCYKIGKGTERVFLCRRRRLSRCHLDEINLPKSGNSFSRVPHLCKQIRTRSVVRNYYHLPLKYRENYRFILFLNLFSLIF